MSVSTSAIPAGAKPPAVTSSTSGVPPKKREESMSMELLRRDNEVLALKIGELQTARWQLDEKVPLSFFAFLPFPFF
jgi:hypothetical protein